MSDSTTSGNLPFASIFSDPLTQGLLGMTAAAGQMAMPTRMPVPFGAVLGAMAGGFGQGGQNAYRTQLEQAQAQQEQLKNQLVQSQLPLQQAQNQWMLNMYQHPEVLQKLFSQGGQAAPNAPALPGQTATGGTSAPSSYTSFILGHEGAGQNPNSSAKGYGGFIDSTWQQFRQENPSLFPSGSGDGRDNPELGAAATQWYAQKNAPVLANAGVAPTGQSLGLAHFLGPQAAAAVMRAPDGASVASVLPAAIGQSNADAYLKANPSLGKATVGDLKAQYASVPSPSFLGQGQQYAQAGNVATDATPGAPATAPSGPASAGQPPAAAPGGGGVSPGDAMNTALQYEARANQMEMISKLPPAMQLPMLANMGMRYEDPTVLRQAAQQYRALALAGPQARAEALAKGQVTPQIDRFGNMYVVDANGTPKYLGRGNEVKIVTDPNHPGRLIYGNVGGEGVGAQPPPGGFAQPQEAPNIPEAAAKEGIKLQAEHGIMPTVPGAPGQALPPPGGNQPMGVGQPAPAAPQSQEIGPGVTLNRTPSGGAVITDTRPQQAAQFHADSEQMKDESESLLSAQQAQMRNQKMRDMAAAIPQSGTAGDQRLAMSTFIKTFFPDKAGEWLTKTANLPDANLGAEFQKLALTSAGSQENAQQGARGGYRLLEMYKKANPGMNLPQNANVEMANLITTANQMDIDYLNGEHQFFQQRATPYLAGQKGYSEPIANYDTQWMAQKNPQVYLGAVYAMSGRPFAEWSKGLPAPEIGRVLDVVKRIDPTSQIMWQDGKPHVFAQAPQ